MSYPADFNPVLLSGLQTEISLALGGQCTNVLPGSADVETVRLGMSERLQKYLLGPGQNLGGVHLRDQNTDSEKCYCQ